MTRHEHLLAIAMEECNELAHRISKALRFGEGETQPGHDSEEINQEWRPRKGEE